MVDDNPGDGLEKCTDVPIQQDLAMDDDRMVGATTYGDELVLGAVQWEHCWFVGDKLDVASVGSKHFDTVIGEINQLPWGSCGLSKYTRRRSKKRQ